MSQDDQLRALRAQVDDLKAEVTMLTNDLADLTLAVAPRPSEARASASWLFPTVDEWVTCHFTVVFVRPLGGEFRWCPRWRDHPEAVARLEALWRSWEGLRCEPAGMATWLTGVLDPQLPILLGRYGPFARCAPTRHERCEPFVTDVSEPSNLE